MYYRDRTPRTVRIVLTAFTATVILATAISTATAGRFSVSNQQFRAVWSNLEFSGNTSEATVRCPVTIEGSFHGRTIVKQTGLLVGYVTRAVVRNDVCTGGHATILQELLPWHLTYQSFTGTLPNITGITFNLIRDGFIVDLGGSNCRALTTVAAPGRAKLSIGAGGAAVSLTIDETVSIPLTNGPGGILCTLASGFGRGAARVTLLGNNNAISVTLI